MSFPLTHLCVAWRVIEKLQNPVGNNLLPTEFILRHPAQFVLGSVAPDAVHYRKEFVGATQSGIGPAKKTTHLCPVSEEKWGYVTDNEGWVQCVKEFLQNSVGRNLRPTEKSLAAGYAVHVLTDIANNMGPWHNFTTNHPQEAAKGYTSAYYTDLKNIDLRLYHEIYKDSEAEKLLQTATPQDMPGLVNCEEMRAIQENLLYVQYKDAPQNVSTDNCVYVTYQQTLDFIENTAEFCVKQLFS